MLRQNISRFFVIPLLLLAGFIGLFCVVEYRKLSNDEKIRVIFNDPVPPLAHTIEVTAAHAKWVYELYRPSSPAKPVDLQLLDETVKELRSVIDALSVYVTSDAFEQEEHAGELEFLAEITRHATLLQNHVTGAQELDEQAWGDSQRSLDLVLQLTRKLSERIGATHREETSEILRDIADDERQRALMAVLVLLAGFVLVLSLLDVVNQCRNSSERVRSAEKYKALLAAALQNTRVGVLIRDMRREGRPVVFINAAFTRLTGYAFEDIKGNSTGFLFGWNTDPVALRNFHGAVEQCGPITQEALLYRKDGSPFWADWHLSPLLGEDGALSHYVSLFSDTTAMRQTQEDLMQAKLMAEHASAVKTNFLAMMSHEIRTPINGILGVLKILGDTSLDADQKHMLGIAMTSSRALHDIINDILDFAKMEAGKVEIYEEVFQVRQLLEDVISIVEPLVGEKRVSLVLEVHESVPAFLVGDPGRLRQIFLNLVSNAIKFTDKGSVTIRVISLMEQEINGQSGVLMRFEVQDTGLGISAEDQGKLFKEFSQVERSFTRRYGGTGLGLAICKRLASMMQGEIGVESQFGHGSKFWFMLPLKIGELLDGASVPLDDSHEPSSCISPETLRVLIVEDNDTNRLVARRYVEKIGIPLDEACNGMQAVEMARATRYDLILMDVSMPVMDGMMATCQIRALDEHNASVPILALTAHAMEGDRQLCLAAGMNDYLNKPLEYATLCKALERWLRLRTQQGGSCAPVVCALDEDEPKAGYAAVVAPAPSDSVPLFVASGRMPAESAALLFDPSVLERMQAELGGDVVRQVTDAFLTDTQAGINALSSPDMQTVYTTAHMLKGCSANCGLNKLSRLMETIEQAAVNQDMARVESLLVYVHGTYSASCSKLERERVSFM